MTACEKYQMTWLEMLSGEVFTLLDAEEHLRACAGCRSEFQELQSLVSALKNISLPDPGELFFARQTKTLLEQIQNEDNFEHEGEALEIAALLRSLPEASQDPQFFAEQSRSILQQIAEELPHSGRRSSPWKKSLLAAAGLGLLCWGMARFVPFQDLSSTAHYQAALRPSLAEDASDLDLEGLTSQELERLATQLEKPLLSENAPDFDDDEADWEDLNESEINLLIERLQENRRST